MLLTTIFLLILISLPIISSIPNNETQLLRVVSLFFSGIVFVLSCLLLMDFYVSSHSLEDVIRYRFGFDFLNLYFSVGIDGISIFLFALDSFLTFLWISFVPNESFFKKRLFVLLLFQLLLLFFFSEMVIFRL